jgi:hypothetical protein
MYRFWFRELAGWLLVAMGLYVFVVCLALLLHPQPGICEASGLSVIGIVVFRGGIHLLKVAVAARVSMAARTEGDQQRAEKSKKKADVPYDW